MLQKRMDHLKTEIDRFGLSDTPEYGMGEEIELCKGYFELFGEAFDQVLNQQERKGILAAMSSASFGPDPMLKARGLVDSLRASVSSLQMNLLL